MHVANIELCKELYELSGWDDMPKETSFEWFYSAGEEGWHLKAKRQFSSTAARTFHERNGMYPAYDLGYLLRKLPRYIDKTRLTIQPTNQLKWCASYDYGNGDSTRDCFANSPEDALCKLAIELFKQNILKKD